MKHFVHYLSLVGVLIFGSFGFYLFPYDRYFQTVIVVALALSYVSWGIIHHIVHKDICMSVVVEYITVAILGIVISLSLINL